jgi:hypothetical protein
MTEDRNVKMVFKNTPQRKSFLGKPRKRWLDGANCLKKMGVRGCWKIAKDREAWKLILENGRECVCADILLPRSSGKWPERLEAP